METELNNLKTIGADMEEAIAKGFKIVIPNINVLFVSDILSRDIKMKLETVSSAEKIQAKAEILKDIYRE